MSDRCGDSTIFGYGEVPVLHPVTAETQASALEALKQANTVLCGVSIMETSYESEMNSILSDTKDKYETQSECLGEWVFGLDTFVDSRRFQLVDEHTSVEIARLLLDGIRKGEFYDKLQNEFPDHAYAAVRNGLECALIDAMATRYGIPLVSLFAGYRKSTAFETNKQDMKVSNVSPHSNKYVTPRSGSLIEDACIKTDITIPICGRDEAMQLAREYKQRGFDTIKVKVGGDTDDIDDNCKDSFHNQCLASDIERLTAIREGFSECKLVIDCNEGI